ncbi:response regulator (plasmid) [Anabaena sp. FACHB-709]|uniref:Two-component response regulator n=3 Tax=Nostocaceae TaxID=1162 RepID=A0A1Z4KWX6_ANAVA|nr:MULTISPECIES: response regulator transcription factor [Nostocaceae]BAY73484.1 two-component response regulator [Trichormus variabilis NIES-23]MBD2174591.1 response regulator transcription factor [Anabaena cylindrica FACHB-318]MBD2266358.1 response regulator transcription factor [Anabaena sp. FACHB-709]MBD2275764.1 response regulator transcription factor [Nostoc sp. PCC 7120 = FACHB-418]MBD2286988.1 response regulator transcription factor [Anabaena cylindrica FACHB-170]
MLRIVIVEPETFTLLGFKAAIEQSPDIEVTGSANCGKIGFQLIEQVNPDVVLVDLLLPDMSGLELTRSIKRKTNSKVVIFTNETHSDFINSAFRHGADSYMLKSADVELIELAIKRAYFYECLLDPKLAKKLLESLYQNRYIDPTFVDKNLIDPPTERQIQVLRLLAQGLVFQDIAKEMFLSVSTVKQYASDLYSKWHVKNRYEAIKRGAMLGYIDYNLIVNE